MNYFFSIIVPVYNVEKYIRRCVDSLLAQTFCDMEILLVDDGSTDGSGVICNEYARRYANVSLIRKQNGGLASARNEGLKYATGEYVSFVDSDDWMEKDSYRIIYEGIADEKVDILNFGYRKICAGRNIYEGHAAFAEGIYDEALIKERILPYSISGNKAFDQVKVPTQLSACMCVYRRSFLRENNLCFESERIVLSEDWLFNISCMCKATKMKIIYDFLYNYDSRSNSLSSSYKLDALEKKRMLYKRYCEQITSAGLMTAEIQRRLEYFWLEMIYSCFSSELNLSRWDRETRIKLRQFCEDETFVGIAAKLDQRNCTIKGKVFLWLAKRKMIGTIRILNEFKKRCKIANISFGAERNV